MKLWTKEWAEAIKEKSYKDREYLRKTKGWSIKFYWICYSRPDGMDVHTEVHSKDGKVLFMDVVEKPHPSDLDGPWDASVYFARIRTDYVYWAKVISKEITIPTALASGHLGMDGRIDEMIKKLPPFAAYVDLTGSFPDLEYKW